MFIAEKKGSVLLHFNFYSSILQSLKILQEFLHMSLLKSYIFHVISHKISHCAQELLRRLSWIEIDILGHVRNIFVQRIPKYNHLANHLSKPLHLLPKKKKP